MALGVATFAMLPLFGLMAMSINGASDAMNRARATESLRSAEAAIKAQQWVSSSSSFQFGSPLLSSGQQITWQIGGSTASYDFAIGQSGAILTSGTGYGALHIQVVPATTISGTTLYQAPLKIYLTAAWPESATYDQTRGWTHAKGFVSSVLYLPCSK